MTHILRLEKTGKFIVLLAFIAGMLAPQPVWAKRHHVTVNRQAHHAALVDGSASYADLVIDAETGQILHATNPDSLRHPASLTKMMTLYLTFQAIENGRLSLNQYLPISANAAEQSPSKLGLRPGQRIRVEDAILGVVTESANDAAVVLGEALGGSESAFAVLMTKQAHALGMLHTHYENPSGLPNPDQVTTARDQAVLGHSLIVHFPQFYPYFSHDSFTYAGIYHHNHNHLMDRYDGMDGIKTGYIRASGFNLVASAKRGNTRLIGVIFGGHSAVARDNQMAQLLDEGFAASAALNSNGHNQIMSLKSMPPVAVNQPFANQQQIAQGDGESNASNEGDEDVTLPAKTAPVVAAVPAPPSAQPAPQRQAVAAPPPPAPKPTVAPPAVAAVVTPPQKPVPPKVAAVATAQSAQPQPQPVKVASIAPLSPPQLATQKAAQAAPPAPSPVTPAPPVHQNAIAQLAMNGGVWGIQVGAFNDPAAGRQTLNSLIKSMPQLLGASDPQVQKVSIGNNVVYRARLMQIDQHTAQTVCSYLLQHGQACLTLGP